MSSLHFFATGLATGVESSGHHSSRLEGRQFLLEPTDSVHVLEADVVELFHAVPLFQ